MANERPAQQSEIKLLISKGLEQGYLTYAEVNDHLPDDLVDPEQIEDIIGIGGNFMDVDAHAVDHADDVFDLLRIDDVVREVIVDFGVSQIALLQALADQELDIGLLRRTFVGHGGCATGSKEGRTPYYTSPGRLGFLKPHARQGGNVRDEAGRSRARR